MLFFENDYGAGAHPEVLRRLAETNMTQVSGYGSDPFSASAREKIRAACEDPEADVEFLVGGTQANAVVLASLLADHEGVIAAQTGHIHVHEAGAVEYTGHKILALPQTDGKLAGADIERLLASFYADETHDHMVFPGAVYLSHPTECGTLYTRQELQDIAALCRRYDMRLFVDGARLGYGLMSRTTDVTLRDLAEWCDAFTIGGTKVGALCGEAVVFPRHGKPAHFLTFIKKRGALLAKGRLLGVQFDALFTEDLYYRIGKYAIDKAEELKQILSEKGLSFAWESPTNQQFVVLTNAQYEAMKKQVQISFWERPDEEHTIVRLATSWATAEEDLAALRAVTL